MKGLPMSAITKIGAKGKACFKLSNVSAALELHVKDWFFYISYMRSNTNFEHWWQKNCRLQEHWPSRCCENNMCVSEMRTGPSGKWQLYEINHINKPRDVVVMWEAHMGKLGIYRRLKDRAKVDKKEKEWAIYIIIAKSLSSISKSL